MSGFSLRNLNLSNVSTHGPGLMKEGKHLVEVTGVEMKDAKTRTYMVIDFTSLEDGSVARARLTLSDTRPGDNYKQAVEIGLRGLKTICTYGGHPNPDNPGSPELLKGLVLVVDVVLEEYTKDNGAKGYTARPREKEGVGYFDPYTVEGVNKALVDQKRAEYTAKAHKIMATLGIGGAVAAPAATGLDDDIPFE